MLHDLNTAAPSGSEKFDVCIVGAGPAGITLALELARKNKRVALCEAGGFAWSDDSQSCYKGNVVGDPYFDLKAARLRYFGGTSGHWAGHCHNLDEIDFLQKPRISPLAYWPIEKKDLEPFYPGACSMVEIKPWTPNKLLSAQHGVQEIFFGKSPPTQFGEKYRKTIVDSKNITLFLNANLVDVKALGGKVSSCRFRSYANKTMDVSAKTYVFAMGGIENSRQLLWLNQKNSGKLYDPALPVGRYWMEHPHFTLGSALVDLEIPDIRYFSLTPKRQMELGILNSGMRFEPMLDSGTKRLVRDLACVAPAAGEWALELAGRKLICGARFRSAWEQEPRFGNRVALSATKDRFGVPAPTLYWRKGDLDRRTVKQSSLQFNQWLMARKFGRLRLDSWVTGRDPYPTNDELAGYHHMGGTRMADSPAHGVVDRNCRVFGSQNLYVAGSSVFPTSGHANPTVTIVQLSLRLANHLAA